MEATIVTVGDEILIGQVIDTNSAWMGQELNLRGIKVQEIISISDSYSDIMGTLKSVFERSDLILMTGGLGPTKDDITKKAIADFYGVEMVFHETTYERIVHFFKLLNKTPTEAHREQCLMPTNATLLNNKMGTAPGMWFEDNGKVLVSMPGVPYEMKSIMEEEVFDRLKKRFISKPIVHKTILTIGEGETWIADRIAVFENSLPENIKLAYLPNLGMVRLRLSATGTDEQVLNDLLNDKVKELQNLILDYIYGYDKDTIQEAVGKLFIAKEKTISIAESCTGGYITHLITSVPGSSGYFMGGFTPYSNKMKEKLLKVKTSTLNNFGAVSEETVIEMVKGTLELFETDIAVAVSGIAGPDGGTAEKPVGTIWLAIGNADKTYTRKLQLSKDRMNNIRYTAIIALNMMRKFLTKEEI